MFIPYFIVQRCHEMKVEPRRGRELEGGSSEKDLWEAGGSQGRDFPRASILRGSTDGRERFGRASDGGDLNTCQAQKLVVLLETPGNDGSHSLVPSLTARPQSPR